MLERPSEDESMLEIAWAVSRRSTCSRLQVGAVLARDGRILSTGRNGAPIGQPHCQHFDDEPCRVSIHAEANSLIFAARHGVATEGASMFLTAAPCLGCSGLLLNAGVRRVVFARPYRDGSGLDRLAGAGVLVERIGA